MDKHRSAFRQKPLVLVVDDDSAVRNSLRFSLQIEGFAVQDYSDGNTLLTEVGSLRSDCLVVDYNLPDMTGLEILGQLRLRHISTPAILITSHPNQALRERAAVVGACVVEKPLLGDALIESIRDILARTRRPSHA